MSPLDRSIDERLSPNHDERPANTTIDMLVLHYTGMKSAADAIDRLCDSAAKVSAHYLIDEDGSICRLVGENRRAWHAGVSYWRGHTDINARSIGIELVNPGHEWGYRQFPDVQMAALIDLASDILARHPISARNVVGHSDIAPRRKTDPGELFNWNDLAEAGIGLAPESVVNDVPLADQLPKMLDEIGYESEDLSATLGAFQRRFRPALIDGAADSETYRLVAGVLAACRRS